MSEQVEHLLIISIGPVQDFIAAARRCQDLWFGSFLLSELARALAKGLVQQGAQLIFPGKLESDAQSVANKIVAILPSGLAPRNAVASAEKLMNDWRDKLAACAFDKCGDAVQAVATASEPLFLRPIAEKQVADLIELQWVAVPITDYAEAHKDAEQLLAWRKHTRDFHSVPWEAGNVPKSSIDGQRESVIKEEFFDLVRNKQRLGAKYRLGLNERLCGVGILKRYGAEIVETPETESEKQLAVTVRPTFHSNSHVAAGPLFRRMNEKAGSRNALHKYIEKLKPLGVQTDRFTVRPKLSNSPQYDGCLLYPDRLPSVFKEDSTVSLDPKQQQDAVQKAQAALQCLFDQSDCSQSEAYYVILAADGDHMGAAINALAGKEGGARNHIDLSNALATFAAQAREIIENAEHAGSLIYSGGDDVLALLPLDTALHCARALSEQFAKTVQPACPKLEPKPTLSVGLAVVHHLEHMGHARKLAQDAEKLAKQKRNSLAIMVDKRSGGTISISGRWDESPLPLDERLTSWSTLLRDEEIPDGVAFELLEVLAPFEVDSHGDDFIRKQDQHTAVIEALVRRVLGRKLSKSGKQGLPEIIQNLLLSHPELATKPLDAVRSLSYELQIAREFLRAQQLAEGK